MSRLILVAVFCALSFSAFAAPSQENADKPPVVYWQTYSSGIIHNSRCRYFRNSNGAEVTNPTSGRDCKICGGTGAKAEAEKTPITVGTDNFTPLPRTIYIGPRGGRYYYNDSGRKVYIRRR